MISTKFLTHSISLQSKAATILRLLGNKTIQFNTRGKKSEPGLREQLNVDVRRRHFNITYFEDSSNLAK